MSSIDIEWQWSYDGWIVVVTSLVAAICAIPGSFLLVRRQSMFGDAIAHAVLPGIAIGFVLAGDRGGDFMLIGAIITGLATSMITQALKGISGIDRGAALGVVFSTLFALGLVIIVRASESVDLDPACVLYGQVELVPLEVVDIGGWTVPRVLPGLLGVFFGVVLTAGLLWKELVISSFDIAMAEAQGTRTTIVNQVLMVLVATACVVAFEAVGSILVVALLIIPAAIARLLTERILPMMLIAMFSGISLAITGHLAAVAGPELTFLRQGSVSTAGMTASLGAVAVGTLAFMRARVAS